MPKAAESTRNLQVRTPGVSAPVPEDTRPDDGLGETDADALSADASDVAIPEASAAAGASAGLPSDMAGLKAYIDAQIASGVAKGLAAERARSVPTAMVLPDQSEVDPYTIKEMTLTKQGYVVPIGYGAAPQHLLQHQVRP